MSSRITLDRAPLGADLLLVSTGAAPGAELSRRLASLGLRRGAHLSLVQPLAAGGRIVSVSGGRIAVERTVLRRVEVEVVA